MAIGTNAYALLGLTAVVAGLVAVLVFSLLRFIAAARATRRSGREDGEATPLLAALEEAMARLKAQSEPLRHVRSLRAPEQRNHGQSHRGLLVVGMNAESDPESGGSQLLASRPRSTISTDTRGAHVAIDSCLATRAPILRRTVKLENARGPCTRRDRVP